LGRTRDLANLPQEIAVDGSGNVQINGATGTYRLNIADASNAFLGFKAGSASPMVVGQDSNGDAYVQNNNNATLRFGTNSAERARIDSNGNLLVGTTTRASVEKVNITHDGANQEGLILVNTNTAAGTQTSIGFRRPSGTTVGTITTTLSATAYNTSSDYRLKHDIQPMQNALAKVAALKPVTYKWNVDDSDGEGFIAHALAEVCPGAVTGEKDAVNEDGSINPQGIDTSFLVATLTAAIQEQQQMIETLQAKVAALEAA
jgi:hypothetical protein